MVMYLPPPVHHSPLVTVLKHIFSNGDYYGATLYLAGWSVTLDGLVLLLVSITHVRISVSVERDTHGCIRTYTFLYTVITPPHPYYAPPSLHLHIFTTHPHYTTLTTLPHPHYTSTLTTPHNQHYILYNYVHVYVVGLLHCWIVALLVSLTCLDDLMACWSLIQCYINSCWSVYVRALTHADRSYA